MQQYDAYFARRHRKRQQTVRVGSDAFKAPLTQEARVTVSVEYYPADAKGRRDFKAQGLAALAKAYPETEGWHDWQFLGAREQYAYAPPPTPYTLEGSAAHLLMQCYARSYPALYGNDDLTPYRVWQQWYFVIGNGMAWHANGALLESGETRSLPELLAATRQKLAAPLTPEYRQELKKRDAFEARNLLPQAWPEPPLPLYPLAHHQSRIFELTDNKDEVEDSFLLAAVDICRYYLLRPLWECCAHEPHLHKEDAKGAVYHSPEWRLLALADGAQWRGRILEAYREMLTGPLCGQLAALGVQEEAIPFDARLPPAWVPGDERRSHRTEAIGS